MKISCYGKNNKAFSINQILTKIYPFFPILMNSEKLHWNKDSKNLLLSYYYH